MMNLPKNSVRAVMVQAFTLISVVTVLCALPVRAAAEEPKRVLVIFSEDVSRPAISMINASLRSTLQNNSPTRIEIYPEYLDSRLELREYESELIPLLRRKFSGRRFDLVYAVGSSSLRLVLQSGAELFPQVPTVFMVLDHAEIADLKLRPDVTGLWGNIDFRPNLELALSLHPETRRVVVVGGVAPFDEYWLKKVRKDFELYDRRVEFNYLLGLSIAEQKEALAALPKDTLVFFVSSTLDNAGNFYANPEVLAKIAPASNAPVYGMTDAQIGLGIVGGQLVSFEAMGSEVARLGLRIMAGEKPETIIPRGFDSVSMFDWRELQRWGIDESKLPAGSVVRFREATFWEQYKWRIVGAVSLIILQTLLIVGLLINRARRRRAEEASTASERRYRNVVETQTELICRYLPDTTLTFVNDAYCRHFGKSREQLIGTKYTQLIPEHARDAALNHIASLIDNPRAETYEHEVMLPNGGRGWHQWVDNVVSTNGHGVELQGIGRDITERRQAEVALRTSETRFQTLADSSPLLIWMSGPDKLCSYVNQGWLEFTGRTIEQELGRGWTEGIYRDDYEASWEKYSSAFERREPLKTEYRLRRADGAYRWLYVSATPRFTEEREFLGYLGSCIDISDRKQAEDALRVAHEEVSKLKNQLQEENIYLQEEIKLAHNVDEIIGESDAIKYVLFKIEQVAQTDTTVLILGETGTGKELVARALHSQSPRKDRPLVKVNCAALSASLIESELFGHEKGAFTGAGMRKMGRFELADGATIFLDEIGELPLELQPKLLRVIQEGELERLGSAKTIKVDVRIIAATNRNMTMEVGRGTFREDLWYRLNVFPITVPPLKQRKEDIPLLVEHFVAGFSKKVGKGITSISAATLKKLQGHSWPGNVRELANVIERGVINAQGQILHIADQFSEVKPAATTDMTQTLEDVEREHITQTLDQTGWRIEGPSGAAKVLGLNPSTLRTRMVKLGIQKSIRSFSAGSQTT